ncbi:amino acid ABC transporter ATP-binding protein [Mesorhizobium sp. IMUNJ 23232]|uniref:amino acid ABC transporter ATP-binding protein n=1 Tax=Mesorhizobium sp. IMUNJ 23232 TaxID=3376064 RepID=UPI003794DF49
MPAQVLSSAVTSPDTAPNEKNDDIVVSVVALNKWFGSFHALKSINLSVRKSERIVICGASGSGKSTLIRCVNGLERFQGGSIEVNGQTVVPCRKQMLLIRRQIGMVFQQFNLFPHLSVLDNCTVALRRVLGKSRHEAEDIALHQLDRVKIPEQADKYPVQLSGGQQQRVAIARALCLQPSIMLFDEPTSALDPEMVKEVVDVMTDLGRDGMTMLCVTHEMGFARRMADTVVFMDQGTIVEVAAASTFFSTPREARTRAFLDKINH